MLNMLRARLTGISVALDSGDCFYLPVEHTSGNLDPLSVKKVIDSLYAHGDVWVHNLKHELYMLPGLRAKDSLLLMWLLHKPDNNGKYGLKGLARDHLGHEYQSFAKVTKGVTFDNLLPEDVLDYVCKDAYYTLYLGSRFSRELRTMSLGSAFELEHAMVPVLHDMEVAGMAIDPAGLESLAVELEGRTAALRAEWDWLLPGVSINSPKQVAACMYGGGHWDSGGIKRTVHGYTVNADTMQKQLLRCLDGSVGKVAAEIRLEYQALIKNLSTYTRSLVAKAAQYPDGRLHPSILQHGTVTGRLSMAHPNLMQVPSHSDLGLRVKACICANPGNSLVAADYSQIDLRVLAHFAGGNIQRAYLSGEDIHQKTADLVGCTRAQAKTVNFAYIYGAGPKRMAETIGVSAQAARGFMDKYQKAYPEVGALRADILRGVRGRGYVRTLGGRIRRFFNLHSPDNALVWADERNAFNTPIQGGAADIMKLAMLKVHRAGLRIVNQVHDELTIECPDNEAEETRKALQQCMQEAYPLKVPLVAEAKAGKRWTDCK